MDSYIPGCKFRVHDNIDLDATRHTWHSRQWTLVSRSLCPGTKMSPWRLYVWARQWGAVHLCPAEASYCQAVSRCLATQTSQLGTSWPTAAQLQLTVTAQLPAGHCWTQGTFSHRDTPCKHIRKFISTYILIAVILIKKYFLCLKMWVAIIHFYFIAHMPMIATPQYNAMAK